METIKEESKLKMETIKEEGKLKMETINEEESKLFKKNFRCRESNPGLLGESQIS